MMNIEEYKKITGKRKNKYNAKKVVVDGMLFDSKKEADYYLFLKCYKEHGAVNFFLRQVPFILPGNVKYRLDFLIKWSDGRISFVDVKGYMTRESKNKIKQVEAIYGIEIFIL